MNRDTGPGFHRVAVVGLGLMGGSLARALKRLSPAPVVLGSTPASAERKAVDASGILDEPAAGDAAATVMDADLVVYATPVGITSALLESHRDLWAPHAIITDVGSLKRSIVQRARDLGVGERFVGGHPMAGSHRSGFAAARADLFEDAPVWLCGTESTSSARSAMRRVGALWTAVGARPAVIEPEAHDGLMALTSQLPQVAAVAVGIALARAGIGPDRLGPGGRDTTRIAASSPDLWSELLLQNRDLLAFPLHELRTVLDELEASLASEDSARLRALLQTARTWRAGIDG